MALDRALLNLPYIVSLVSGTLSFHLQGALNRFEFFHGNNVSCLFSLSDFSLPHLCRLRLPLRHPQFERGPWSPQSSAAAAVSPESNIEPFRTRISHRAAEQILILE